ncbi:M20/M25/M40 family metallo-hydrolase [Streptomyces coeruleorubidus]|uniref:M20/M25/M40 family metallo-hydrolase n=1 Tax=Streptomyces coeruleorubidus TaxID=116188 RepID=UPI003808372A
MLTAGLAAVETWTHHRLGPPDDARRYDGGPHGDVLELLHRGTSPAVVLVLCHYDTVWPAGTLAEWPFRVSEDDRATGPGVFDMKCGRVQAVWALRLLRDLDLPRPSVRLFLNGDEEIGSPASRPVSERLSEDAAATLVCEASAGPEGALKTSRKGVGLFEVTVEGVEAHAGLDPHRGAGAVHALAELVTRIAGLGSRVRGTTVNVGLISGGTGRNVVAGRAGCGIDVRIPDPAEAARVDAAPAPRSLRPPGPGLGHRRLEPSPDGADAPPPGSCSGRRVRRRRSWGGPCGRRPSAERATATSSPRSTIPSSTAWARWATAPRHGTSTSCWTTYRRAPHCWRGSSWRGRRRRAAEASPTSGRPPAGSPRVRRQALSSLPMPIPRARSPADGPDEEPTRV